MTTLTITPKTADKTARFRGTVAAGEHVAVTIKGGAEWLGDDNGAHLSLRVIDFVTGRTLALFPRPEETLEDGDEPDAWSVSAEDPDDLFCNLNLNTDRMVNAARHMLRVPVLFVMGAKDDENPATTRTLYFRDRYEVEFWPERVGDDTPYDLDRWPKQIDEWTGLIAEFGTRIDAAEDSIRGAVDEANGIVAHVDAAKTAAQNSATAAGDSASAAQGSAATAKNWATGGGEIDDPGATNNAKYYAQQAGDAKTDAAASATSAAASATAAANSATAASGSATSAASSAQSAAGAAEAAVETEKERAEGAEGDLADAIVAEKERAEGAEALAIVNAEYNGTDRRIVFTTGGGETKTIDASAFIKDGMISSVSVSNGNLVITFNSDAGKQPISIPLTQIFNPSNYYDKTAADNRFVRKEAGKGLSSNDYTTAEKTKLSGIATNANAYVLPPASASTLGGVKVGANLSIDANGVLSATGGSSVTVDDALSATSANPVQNKVIATALETGYTAWKWDVAGASAGLGQPGYDTFFSDKWSVDYEGIPWASTETSETATELHFDFGTDFELHEAVATRTRITPKKTSQLTNDGNGTSAFATVAQVAMKADAASLPYALVTVTPTSGAPFVLESCFPISWEDGDTHDEYEVTLADRARISVESFVDDKYIVVDSEYGGICIVNADGTYDNLEGVVQWVSLNGSPTENVTQVLGFAQTATLTDRAINAVTLTSDATLVFPAQTAGKARDFLVRLTIPAGDAPQIAYPEGVTFENADGSFPEINTDENAAASTLLMFTETAPATGEGANATPARFLVKGEVLKEVPQ